MPLVYKTNLLSNRMNAGPFSIFKSHPITSINNKHLLSDLKTKNKIALFVLGLVGCTIYTI